MGRSRARLIVPFNRSSSVPRTAAAPVAEALESRRLLAAQFVSDVNPNHIGPSGSPSSGVVLNETVYFLAYTPAYGTELWASDGTANGTKLVRDLLPGSDSSGISLLTSANGSLYFFANDGSGLGLWKSDGTSQGTQKIFAPPNFSTPKYLTSVGNKLFFVANDGYGTGAHGEELYVSDGTMAGTQMLDINAGPGSSSPMNLTDYNGTLFCSVDGNDGVGRELWTSDGTLPGTHLFKDINPGAGSSYPQEVAVASGKLLFAAEDGVTGGELYVSDGTPAGTQRITDISPGPQGGLYYGTGNLSSIQSFFSDGTTYYFAADTGSGVNEVHLWKSDGTAAGTTIVSSSAFSPKNFARTSDGKIFFNGSNPNGNGQLWVTQGTSATILAEAAFVSAPTVVAGQAYFMQRSAGSAGSLIRTDGSSSTLVKTFDDATFTPLGALGSSLLFQAYTTATGRELWSTDGNAAGTQLVRDFSPDASDSSISGITKSGNFAFFQATGAVGGPELYATNLTSGITSLVKDLTSAASGGQPSYLTDVDGTLFFDGYDGTTWRVWKSDGTTAGTTVVSTSGPTVDPANFFLEQEFVSFQHALYFVGADTGGTMSLWRTDGTNTTRIKQIPSDNKPFPEPMNLQVVGNSLYFFSPDTLWKSDGTTAGTVPVTDPTGHPSLGVAGANGALFFIVSSGTEADLWTSDGTAAGTRILSTNVADLLGAAGSSVYFTKRHAGGGIELWTTDGTDAGTDLVVDIHPEPLASSISSPVDVGGTFYFVVNDGMHGYEIWTSDGTAAGTHILDDLVPGTGDMHPTQLAAVGTDIYFAATDDAHGQGLWRLTDTYAPVVTGSGYDTVGAVDGPTLNVHFSENVVGVDAGKLSVTDQSTGQTLPAGTLSLTYSADKHLASFTAPAGLPDGNYQAVLDPSGISDAAQNSLAGGVTVPFFILSGDANHDRYVNTIDFTAMAQHFGKTSATFSEGDFNYDGVVNALDFNILATKFGTYLAPPMSSAPIAQEALAAANPVNSIFGNRPVAIDQVSNLLD